jgi:glycosyltransferase involved in cell wall biosynthesis
MLPPVTERTPSREEEGAIGSPHGAQESPVAATDRDVTVSVVVMTYNHEQYIAQALDSVLEQATAFPFEVIITEDCSTDGTRQLIQKYQERHPDRIRLMLSPHNLNDNSVLSRAVLAARGKYVALLDGDDWWTSKDKLAEQVRLLDAEQDVSICFHNVQVVYESGEVPSHEFHLASPLYRLSAERPERYTGLADMVGGNYIQTCSVMFRAHALDGFPDWYVSLPVGDWPLYVLLAERGRIAYLDRTWAAYRVHDRGVWSSGLSYNKRVDDIVGLLDTYAVLDRHLHGRYRGAIENKSSYLHRAAAVALFHDGEFRRAVRYWHSYGQTAGLRSALFDRTLWVKAMRCVAARGGAAGQTQTVRDRLLGAPRKSSPLSGHPADATEREGP